MSEDPAADALVEAALLVTEAERAQAVECFKDAQAAYSRTIVRLDDEAARLAWEGMGRAADALRGYSPDAATAIDRSQALLAAVIFANFGIDRLAAMGLGVTGS